LCRANPKKVRAQDRLMDDEVASIHAKKSGDKACLFYAGEETSAATARNLSVLLGPRT